MKKNFLKSKELTLIFSAIALIGGFFFLENSTTGNVISETNGIFNILSIIGLLLVLCSMILAGYSISRKKTRF